MYGLAGVLVAYDTVAHLAQGALQGARQVVDENKNTTPTPVATEHNGTPVTAGVHVLDGEVNLPGAQLHSSKKNSR